MTQRGYKDALQQEDIEVDCVATLQLRMPLLHTAQEPAVFAFILEVPDLQPSSSRIEKLQCEEPAPCKMTGSTEAGGENSQLSFVASPIYTQSSEAVVQ
ncbi:TPA: hypothetical protein ACH3X2_013954 [Trebouxia sp. C0005]